MIIELKDIPKQPIKKIDVHIEFDTSKSSDNPVSVSFEPLNEQKSSETPEIPSEMINADF